MVGRDGKGRSERRRFVLDVHVVLAYNFTRGRGEKQLRDLFFFFVLAERRKILPARKSVLPKRVCPGKWLLADVRANTARHISDEVFGFYSCRDSKPPASVGAVMLYIYKKNNNNPKTKLRLRQDRDIFFNRQTA